MFIGHYAVSFAFKAKEDKVSLGLLFIAVQFIDILFFPLTLLGIEKFKLIENFTQSTHFQLEFMPYSHSLLAVLLWAIIAYFLLPLVFGERFGVISGDHKSKNNKGRKEGTGSKKVAALIALAVLSHWLLDFIVHTPDLPLLIDNSNKVGLGLWNNDLLTYLLEAVLVIGGLYLYMKATGVKSTQVKVSQVNTTEVNISKVKAKVNRIIGKYGMPIFVVLLLLINLVNIFGPLSADETNESVAITSVITYFVLALIAYWLDKKRSGYYSNI